MTRSIHADLLTTQKKTAYKPAITVTFADNGLPHPTLVDNSLTNYSGNPTASCVTSEAIIRAHRVAGVGVQVQVITDPTVTAQWEAAWTTVDADGYYPALFWTGSTAVLVYQDSSNTVKFRTSTDHGASWSAATNITAAGASLNNTTFGISGGAERSGFCYAIGSTLTFFPYNETANAFPSAYNHDAGATLGACSGAWSSGNTYYLALVIANYATWTDSAIILKSMTWTGSGAPSFGTAVLYNAVHGGAGEDPAYQFNYASLSKVGSKFWLAYTYNAVAANGALYDNNDTLIAVSEDGTHFTSGLRTGQAIADRLQANTWSSGVTYLCSDLHLLTSTPVTTIAAPTADIKALDIADYAATAYAEITLDNRASTYDSLAAGRLGCDITIERGAVCQGTARTVARETFIASRFTREDIGKTITVRAYNYHRLLTLWHAELPYYFASIALSNLVIQITALAGIYNATFAINDIWATIIGEFFIQPGQSAAQALLSLQDQFQFVSFMSTGTTIRNRVLTASPSTDYTFGTGANEHQTLAVEDNADRSAPDITHAEVMGSNAGGQAFATDLQAEMGRQFSYRIERELLTTNTDCETVADSIVTKLTSGTERAILVALPAFHLAPFDAISSDDFADNTVRYVTMLRETYNPSRKDTIERRDQNWRQTITLAALTPTAGGHGASINAIVPEGLKRSDFRKGNIISFNTSTWKALVRFADTAGAVEIPVAQYLTPANLTTGRRVAVIQFDVTNPADGLVVASYGTASWRQFDRLYASDGDPGPAWYTDASGNQTGVGNLTLASGKDVFPWNDTQGLHNRLCTLGVTPTNHYTSSFTISGYAWSHFNGTPTSPSVSGSWVRLQPTNNTTKHCYAKAISGTCYAMLRGTHWAGCVGVAFYDSANAPQRHVALVIRNGTGGGQRIRLNGFYYNASATEVSRFDWDDYMSAMESIALRLDYNASTNAFTFYLQGPRGNAVGIDAISGLAWTPTHGGIFLDGPKGTYYGDVDWYASNI